MECLRTCVRVCACVRVCTCVRVRAMFDSVWSVCTRGTWSLVFVQGCAC